MDFQESLDKLLKHSHQQSYKSASHIIEAGTAPPDTLYYIISGSVSVMLGGEENTIILDYLNPGDFFGEMGLFEPDSRRSATVITRTQSEIAAISYRNFRELAQQDPNLMFMLASQLAKRLRHTNSKVKDLAFLDVTGRVAHTLLEMCEQPDAMTHPEGMQIRITRQEIARIVGCSREMAGRVIKDLEEQGLIQASGKTMVILGYRPPNAPSL